MMGFQLFLVQNVKLNYDYDQKKIRQGNAKVS